eukprot:scaffold7973_cov30-Phaeocystis_antarctica.AAC.1
MAARAARHVEACRCGAAAATADAEDGSAAATPANTPTEVPAATASVAAAVSPRGAGTVETGSAGCMCVVAGVENEEDGGFAAGDGHE